MAPEGGSVTYTVALEAEPADVVTVTVAGASGELMVSPSKLPFSADNWNQAQTVTVSSAQDDDALADAVVTLTHTAAGGGYDDAPLVQVLVTVAEDEAAVTELSITSSPGADGGAYGLGEVIVVTVRFNAPVTVDTANGTPSLRLTLGGASLQYVDRWIGEQRTLVAVRRFHGRQAARDAGYNGGSGTSALSFAYTVTEEDSAVSLVRVGANSLFRNGGAIRDSNGIDAKLAHRAASHNASAVSVEHHQGPPEEAVSGRPVQGFAGHRLPASHEDVDLLD